MEVKRLGGAFTRLGAWAVPLLVGCTLDITEVPEASDDERSDLAVPAVLIVGSHLMSTEAGEELAFLRTVVDLHPGIGHDGLPRVAAPVPMDLHGTLVEPEVRSAGDVTVLRWSYQDSVAVGRRTLHITPPSVSGLTSPPPMEVQVGVDLQPAGDIRLSATEDLVLHVASGEAPSGFPPDALEYWSLRIGELSIVSSAPVDSPLVVSSTLLRRVTFPAMLDLQFGKLHRHDPDASPWYQVEIRTASEVRREVSRDDG